MKHDPLNLPAGRVGRRQFLGASIGLGSVLIVPQTMARHSSIQSAVDLLPRHWQSRPLLGFGTTLSLTVGAEDIRLVDRALDLAVADIRMVEAQMSLFNPMSAISQLNTHSELRDPHPLFLKVLTLAQAVSRKSDGAFDVTVQPLWEAYANAQQQGRLPTHSQLYSARAQTGWQHLEAKADCVRFKRPQMAITLNGIAQGFAADLIRTRWQAMGIRHALINTGEWTASGAAQDGQTWRLGIADPRDEARMVRNIALSGKSVATSADNQTYFTPDFKNHHIFDPHTGRSPSDVASVTVVAHSTALADALTKVMFVGGMRNGLRLAKLWSVDVLMIDKAGNWIASPGLNA